MGDAKGRVLILAGSDSGGGAGVQADIKAVTMLGGFAATAITALQFQDMVSQLIGHVDRRVDGLNSLMTEFDALSDGIRHAVAAGDTGPLCRATESVRTQLSVLAATVDNSPVRQQEISHGEIDLF